jgi:recombinational DNA repair protein (RecF pathway)
MSARLDRHYGQIVKDIECTNVAYELIKLTQKATEDDSDSGYFDLLNQVFIALDDSRIDAAVIKVWFQMHLLGLAGHTPDLKKDINDDILSPQQPYDFDLERMALIPVKQGIYAANDIKFLRLGFGAAHPQNLARVNGATQLAWTIEPLLQSMLKMFFRL